jgi:hypothetical protein
VADEQNVKSVLGIGKKDKLDMEYLEKNQKSTWLTGR